MIHKPDNTNAFGYNPSANGTDQPDRIAAEDLNQGLNKTQSHLLRIELGCTDNVTFTSITDSLINDTPCTKTATARLRSYATMTASTNPNTSRRNSASTVTPIG